MSNQVPVFALVQQSGPVGILVIVILTVLSVGMWAVIISKIISNKKKNAAFNTWFKDLKATKNLSDLQKLGKDKSATSFGRISQSAIQEIEELSPYVSYGSLEARTQLVQDSVQRAVDREVNMNDKSLSYLALCSSVSPFLGLFGTVWGIMHSFLEIGQQGSANITVVAPGIAEALVTTIVGLAVAIPAAATYNYFVTFNRKFEAYMFDFASEILSLFKRGDLKALEQARAQKA